MIKVQIDELEKDVVTLNSAIESFKPYSADFMTDSASRLKWQNSDFINKIRDTLEVMTDTKAPELLKKIQQYSDDVEKLVKDFRKKDEELSKGLNIK
ncbi:hypothetical protein NNC19_15680 [Clostridium sp. SHJSY1]|uniref:hypothetical protein n=1 Tax=Clostridium sp. SHJSY1 TaxID=2942483 RepID=UPI0028753A26|nr:hypothetical protein [Clostridium sp. SHJSY1]MDS0527131.1 hypothetical protein [Clostridium sp. SHJSY1]